LFSLGNAYAADNLDSIQNLGQQKTFKLFSEDLGAVVAYRSTSPAEPLGATGFDIGIEATSTSLPNSKEWALANSDGEAIDSIVLPRVHIHKGLPFGIDIGASYVGSGSDTDISITGAEIKYAFMEGSTATPALALRITYSSLSGIDQLEMTTTGAELSISKGFALFTPYAGVGYVSVTSTPKAEAAEPVPGVFAGFEEETFGLSKAYAGVNMALGIVSILVEGDKTGEATSYSLKLALRW